MIFKEIDQTGVRHLLNNLSAKDGNWIFKNFESAKKYAELFLKLNTDYYAGLPSAVMFRTVGDCLRYALQKDYISEDDFYTTDKLVLSKLSKYLDRDEKLKLLFDRMNNKIGFCNNSQNYDVHVFCKSRVVDPLCNYNGERRRISEIDQNWAKIIKQELKPKEYFIKFEK